MGCKKIVHPYFGRDASGQAIRDPAVYRALARDLNKAGRLAERAGLDFGYHNHQLEFVPLTGGSTGFDILTSQTDPRLVHFELDLYWTWRGAHDPVDVIRANRGRIRQVHVKDLDVEGGLPTSATASSTSVASSPTSGTPASRNTSWSGTTRAPRHAPRRRTGHRSRRLRLSRLTPVLKPIRGRLDEQNRIRFRAAAGHGRSGRTTVSRGSRTGPAAGQQLPESDAQRLPGRADEPRRPARPARAAHLPHRRGPHPRPAYRAEHPRRRHSGVRARRGGLAGVAIDPNFAQNKWVYLYYSPPLNTPVDDPATRASTRGRAGDRHRGGLAAVQGALRLSRFSWTGRS
ncbi:hypothetical protein NKG94_10010 [Micromonospora sp. M12]